MTTTNLSLPAIKIDLKGQVLVPDLPLEGQCIIYPNALNLEGGMVYIVTSLQEVMRAVDGTKGERFVGFAVGEDFVVKHEGVYLTELKTHIQFLPNQFLDDVFDATFEATGGHDMASALLDDKQKRQYTFDALNTSLVQYNVLTETLEPTPDYRCECGDTVGIQAIAPYGAPVKFSAKSNYSKHVQDALSNPDKSVAHSCACLSVLSTH